MDINLKLSLYVIIVSVLYGYKQIFDKCFSFNNIVQTFMQWKSLTNKLKQRFKWYTLVKM